MKSFKFDSFGLENLKYSEHKEPETLNNTQVLIQIKAVSLNYRDLMMIRGEYNPKQKLPLIPASDGAGEVLAVGEEVKDFKIGDRVMPIMVQNWLSGPPKPEHFKYTMGGPLQGMLREKAVFLESALLKIPNYLSFEEASTLPCAALTAYRALFGLYNLKPSETVLLQGTGGVSLFALQLAKTQKSKIIILSRSDQKLEKAKKLGANLGVNYRNNPDWGKELASQADLILELGGASTIKQSVRAIKPGGQINLIGKLGGGKIELDLVSLFMRQIKLQGIYVGPKEDFLNLNKILEKHQIKPIIDKVFDFRETRNAFESLASAQHMGKIVIKI